MQIFEDLYQFHLGLTKSSRIFKILANVFDFIKGVFQDLCQDLCKILVIYQVSFKIFLISFSDP